MGKKEEKQTTYVYIMDDDHAWRPAILDETKGDKAHVRVFQYKVCRADDHVWVKVWKILTLCSDLQKEEAMRSDGGRGADKKLTEATINLKHYPSKVLPLQNVDHNGILTPAEKDCGEEKWKR